MHVGPRVVCYVQTVVSLRNSMGAFHSFALVNLEKMSITRVGLHILTKTEVLCLSVIVNIEEKRLS